ncbi:hypothetical protein JFQ96_002952 [Edwardsiella piscicida]|nr:hypothetical protein [Edwardsiella piscicida]
MLAKPIILTLFLFYCYFMSIDYFHCLDLVMEDSSVDDDLAPMVDGLSGALCALILVCVVFIISATDVITASRSNNLSFRDSTVDFSKKTIFYSGALSLSDTDILDIRDDFLSQKYSVITFYGAISDKISSHSEKNTYNLLKLYAKLELPKDIEVKFKQGDVSLCGNSLACIYWSAN